QEQSGALVGGEAASEADGEDLRVQGLLDRGQLDTVRAETLELSAEPPPREGHEPLAEPLLGAPELAVRDLADPLPDALVERLLEPVGAEVAFVEARELVGEPGLRVDPVRDRADGDLPLRHAGPDPPPHAPRD